MSFKNFSLQFLFFLLSLTKLITSQPVNGSIEDRNIAENTGKLVLGPVAVVAGANSAIFGATTVKLGQGVKVIGTDIAASGDQISRFGEGVQGAGSYLFDWATGFAIPIVNTGDQIQTLKAICKLPLIIRRITLDSYINELCVGENNEVDSLISEDEMDMISDEPPTTTVK